MQHEAILSEQQSTTGLTAAIGRCVQIQAARAAAASLFTGWSSQQLPLKFDKVGRNTNCARNLVVSHQARAQRQTWSAPRRSARPARRAWPCKHSPPCCRRSLLRVWCWRDQEVLLLMNFKSPRVILKFVAQIFSQHMEGRMCPWPFPHY